MPIFFNVDFRGAYFTVQKDEKTAHGADVRETSRAEITWPSATAETDATKAAFDSGTHIASAGIRIDLS
jgi:hypothetical protein